jgi:hypothetical protein
MSVSVAQRYDARAVLVLARTTVGFRKPLLFAVQRLDEHVVERVLTVSRSVQLAHHAACHFARDRVAT